MWEEFLEPNPTFGPACSCVIQVVQNTARLFIQRNSRSPCEFAQRAAVSWLRKRQHKTCEGWVLELCHPHDHKIALASYQAFELQNCSHRSTQGRQQQISLSTVVSSWTITSGSR